MTARVIVRWMTEVIYTHQVEMNPDDLPGELRARLEDGVHALHDVSVETREGEDHFAALEGESTVQAAHIECSRLVLELTFIPPRTAPDPIRTEVSQLLADLGNHKGAHHAER